MKRVTFVIRLAWTLLKAMPRTLRRAWCTYGMSYAQSMQWELRQTGTEWTIAQCESELRKRVASFTDSTSSLSN